MELGQELMERHLSGVFKAPVSVIRMVALGENAGADSIKTYGYGKPVRIDYQIATPGIAATARAASIYRNRRFSDHAPLVIDYEYDLR